MKDDLRQYVEDYIKEKHWPLREYCRDTERVLGAGNGISVTTLSWLLRGSRQITVQTVQRMAAYHGLAMDTAMRMAGYLPEAGESGKRHAELVALRQQMQNVIDELDRILAEG
jgi:transcriptional regulator with XRE-family HTH domain